MIDAPMASGSGSPNTSVSSGTTKTPPPSPTSEPISPAAIDAVKTSRKKSRCGGAAISRASPTEQQANQQNQQHDQRNDGVEPVAFERKDDDRDGDAQNGGEQQDQQAERDEGQRLALGKLLRDLDQRVRIGEGSVS